MKASKGIKSKLDKLVGTWVRTKKTGGRCEYCGKRATGWDMQWCHVKSRRYLSVRWSLNNSYAFCASCHRWFTDNPDRFVEWLLDYHPLEYTALQDEFRESYPMKEYMLEELYNKLKKKLHG